MTDYIPFSTAGRERFVAVMNSVQYVEMEAFRGKESYNGYFCKSCPAMMKDERSPTGYWCQKYGFPDREHGCCNGWYPFPETADKQRR